MKSLSLPESIKRFQDYVTKAKIHLNYVIAPNLYLISNDFVMKMGRIEGYNNTLIIAEPNTHFGINRINNMKVKALVPMQGAKFKKQTNLKEPVHKNNLTNDKQIKEIKPNKFAGDSNIKLGLIVVTSAMLSGFLYFKRNKP